MQQKITPFLWFDRNAKEAMNFYVSVFNGNPNKKLESKIIKIKKYPDKGLEGPMKGFEGQVLTGIFELEGQQYMCLDGGPIFKSNESFSILVDCKNQEEIDYFWDAFTKDGGQESQCGWLKDKYGFSWQISPPMEQFMSMEDSEKSKKVMHAFLQMKKIDIAKLQEAAN